MTGNSLSMETSAALIPMVMKPIFNPIIYISFNRSYREHFIKKIKCKK